MESLRRNSRHLKATQERQVEETTTDQANTYPGDSSKEQDRTKKQMKLNTRKTSGRPREPPGTTTRNDINASKNKVGMDCKTTIISDRRPIGMRACNNHGGKSINSHLISIHIIYKPNQSFFRKSWRKPLMAHTKWNPKM